jgi:hypothetical protein
MKLNNILLTVALFVTSTIADDLDIRFNYFGNLTGSSLDRSDYRVIVYDTQYLKDTFQIESYSKLGGQITVSNDKFMFVAQEIAHRHYKKMEYDLSWFNLKYNINNNFSIRAGRMQSPIFLHADTLDVDYLHLWAVTPSVVYGLMPFRSIDGIELIYTKVIEDYYVGLEFIVDGKTQMDIDDLVVPTTLYLDDAKVLSASLSNNNFEIKATYSTSIINMDLSSPDYNLLISTLNAYGNDVSKYNFTNKKFKVMTLGINYNYDNYLATAEVATRKSNSLYPDELAYYLELGYKYDKFTPYIIYANNKNDKEHFNIDNIIVVDDTSGYLKNELKKLLYTTNASQKTISVGIRYDLKPGVALKMQLDKHTTTDYGVVSNVKRDGYLGRDAGVENKSVYQLAIGLSFAF